MFGSMVQRIVFFGGGGGVVNTTDLALWDVANATTTGSRITSIADSGTNGYNSDISEDGTSGPTIVNSWRNGQPAAQGATGKYLRREKFNDGGDGIVDQTFTIYVVGEWIASTNAFEFIFDSNDATRRTYFVNWSTSGPGFYAGNIISSPTAPTAVPFVARIINVAGAATVRVEPHGRGVIEFTGDAGSSSMDGLTWGANYLGSTAYWLGKIALIGIHNGDDTVLRGDAYLEHLRSRYNIIHS